MAFDRELAERIREALRNERGVTERRMFGGLAFFVNGNLAASASSAGGLLVRVEPSSTETLVSMPLVRRRTMRGREMAGWLQVETAALQDEPALQQWVRRGADHARSLPPK